VFGHRLVSGWDENEDDNLTEEVTKFTTDYCEKSIIFSEYENFCMDLFQTLIILPLEKCDYQNPKRSFRAFLTEWVKIENTISNAYYNLYILKGAIEAARYVRVAYMDESTSKEATKTFSEMLHQTIDKVAKFCKPKPIDYEKCFVQCMFLLIVLRVYTTKQWKKEWKRRTSHMKSCH